VTAVGWDKSLSSPSAAAASAGNNKGGTTHLSSTGEVLVGTADGDVYEMSMEASDKGLVDRLIGGKEAQTRRVFSIGESRPITSLEVEHFPASPSAEAQRLVVLTTPTRIYEFIGGPSFADVFSSHDEHGTFQEVPGSICYSHLSLFAPYADALPNSFAWITSTGIYHGGMVFGSQGPGEHVLTDVSLAPYPPSLSTPVALVLTEYHFLLADAEGHFVAVNKLSEEVVYETTLTGQRIVGLTRDPTGPAVFLLCTNAVFEVSIVDEGRDVWELHLKRRAWNEAEKAATTHAQREQVYGAQADYYYREKQYDLAARYYAKTDRPFEQIALSFVDVDERLALRTYLLERLEALRDTRDATQSTALATWLTEIYLDNLNEVQECFESLTAAEAAASGTRSSPALTIGADHSRRVLGVSTAEDAASKLDLFRDEFRQFLDDHRGSLDPKTTFTLISSHGRVEELLYYATLIGDFEKVAAHHVQRSEWDKALDVVAKQNAAELYYRFSPVLIRYIPRDLVNVWISAHSYAKLRPAKLVPALTQYRAADHNESGDSVNHASRYLRHAIFTLRDTDPVLVNSLVRSLAADEDEEALIHFLESAPALQSLDLRAALGVTLDAGHKRASIQLYATLGLFEEAVGLALALDLDLAMATADKADEEDTELRRRLWLRIAKHVVEKEQDIKKAMSFLSSCDLLSIEDILPFFSDFVLIDDFKAEICESLEAYNRRIEALKSEMNDATRSAELIRADVRNLRNRHGFVAAGRRCDHCGVAALQRKFYLFPCQHVLHADCLREVLQQYLSGAEQRELRELEQAASRSDAARARLDEMLAGECALCGEFLIETIARPLLAPEDADEAEKWRL
jgi:hypothetical protein